MKLVGFLLATFIGNRDPATAIQIRQLPETTRQGLVVVVKLGKNFMVWLKRDGRPSLLGLGTFFESLAS